MNTEKIEKLKKGLTNSQIPENLKQKIREQIAKLEAEIKTDESMTATEVKKEVAKIEEKVEDALEVAEKKEEQIENKKTRKPRTKKQSETNKPKRTAMSLAKEIRKEGESWSEARARASKMMKDKTQTANKDVESELDKLNKIVRSNSELKGQLGNANLLRDAKRKALPSGKRISYSGEVYYETRANRTDKGTYGKYHLEKGGKFETPFNVIYTTKSGRTMVASNIMALNEEQAKEKLKQQMRASESFDKIVMAHKSFEDGGSIEDDKFKKFISSQINYIISLKTISQKKEPIKNLLENMEDYKSGSEIVKRITSDNLKYALQQNTVSKINEVLRTSLNALEYANGGYLTDPNFGNFQNTMFAYGGGVKSKSTFRSNNSSLLEYANFTDGSHINLIKLNRAYKSGHSFAVSVQEFKDEQQVLLFKNLDKAKEKFDYLVAKAKEDKTLRDEGKTNNYELGGTVVTDLAGHTGGSFGTGNPSLLSGVSGTHYTGLVGETGAMSSGEMFMAGGGLPSGAEQSYMITEALGNPAQHYAKGGTLKKVGRYKILGEIKGQQPILYASTNDKNRIKYLVDMAEIDLSELTGKKHHIFVTDEVTDDEVFYYKKGGAIENQYEGKTPELVWNMLNEKQKQHFLLDHFNNFDVDDFKGKNLIEISKLDYKQLPVLVRKEFDYHISSGQYEFGGDFQAGVYAKGGTLQAHGIEVGDTFVKTISGGIQKVKDKNGNVVYVNLANGERDKQPPLPFDDGGEVMYYTNKDGIRVRSKVEPEKKLTEAQWMAKHNASKEARTYGFGGLFSKSAIMSRPKRIDLNEKQVKLKSGEYVQVLNQEGSSLMVIELSKLGTGTPPRMVNLSDVDMTSFATGGRVGKMKVGDVLKKKGSNIKVKVIEVGNDWRSGYDTITIYNDVTNDTITLVDWSDYEKTSFATGGALIGNQKRIDMNKNGKIDAEDFKLLRSSMNGAWRNERKHVNHDEDYEVRYAKKKPSRTGYKGKRKFKEGGGISNFERLSRVVAKNYEGKRVKPQYQKEYGKVYSKSEAKEVGNKVAGKMKMMKKAESGAEVKKSNKGGVMVLAKQIRKEGESWKDALKRAGQQLK